MHNAGLDLPKVSSGTWSSWSRPSKFSCGASFFSVVAQSHQHVVMITIVQYCGSGNFKTGSGSSISSESESGYGSGSRVLTTTKLKKQNTAETKNFFLWSKIALYLSIGLHQLSFLKREHPELQKMKFINFFLFLWVIFSLLDPQHSYCVWFHKYQLQEQYLSQVMVSVHMFFDLPLKVQTIPSSYSMYRTVCIFPKTTHQLLSLDLDTDPDSVNPELQQWCEEPYGKTMNTSRLRY